MTVDDVLRAIAGACRAFDATALASWGPVFHAHLDKHEGPALREAHMAVMVNFKPSGRTPFPVPAEYVSHLPTGKIDMPDVGKPIRDELERRINRRRRLITEWLEGQGAKIRATRPKPLFSACLLEAMDQAKIRALDERVERLVLSADQLKTCFQRAISVERRQRFGNVDRFTSPVWWDQVSGIAAEWGLSITPEWWGKSTAVALTQKEAA